MYTSDRHELPLDFIHLAPRHDWCFYYFAASQLGWTGWCWWRHCSNLTLSGFLSPTPEEPRKHKSKDNSPSNSNTHTDTNLDVG